MTRATVIAGNWKLNPARAEGERLFREIGAGVSARAIPSHVHVVVFPPAPFLPLLASNDRVRVGAQNVSAESWGAHTGEVGATLLKEFGIAHAIVGHSERRQHFGESDELIARKVEAAVRAGITPVVCIGESGRERDAGETFAVLARQMEAIFRRLQAPVPLVLAYEPVWAIGTGKNATPEQAEEAHAFLREYIGKVWSPRDAHALPILYGGSVTPENAPALFAREGIDGALVGGASLKAESFLSILDSALAGGRN